MEVKNCFSFYYFNRFNSLPNISFISSNPFNTHEVGFLVSQIGFNSKLQNNHLIFHNCAPRKDNLDLRLDNDGEFLAATILTNNVLIIGVYSGYSFSFFNDVYKLNCKTTGSQFRSRDIFPEYSVNVYKHYFENNNIDPFIVEKIQQVPKIENDIILYIDGYGNIKNNIIIDKFLERKVKITINHYSQTCFVSNKGIFSVKDGEFILAYGSSGWDGNRFAEIVLRGGNAAKLFNNPKPGDKIFLEIID